MPLSGGAGYGMDSMVMFLTYKTGIRDVLMFPTLKSLGK